MRWTRVALYSVASLVAVVAIAIIIALNTDLGRFKGQAESVLSGIFAREFAIDGPLHVKLGRNIEISADDVRLAGVEWGAGQNLLQISHLSASVQTLSLLSGPVTIEHLEIRGVRANLEQNEAGANNWSFSAVGDEPDVSDDLERPSMPVLVTDAKITDTELTYNSPKRSRPFQFTASDIGLSRLDTDFLELTLDGAINETPVALLATAGTIDPLIEFGNARFTLKGNFGEILLEGDALLEDLIEPQRPTATLSIQGPNAEYLTQLLGTSQITTGPMHLTASIAPLGETMLLTLNGEYGEFSIDASGHFDNLQNLQDVDFRVAASGPSAATIGKLLGNDTVPEDPFNVVCIFSRSGNNISIEQIAVAIGKTRFEVGGVFDNFPDPGSARLKLRIDGPDFGRFNRLLGLPGRLIGPFSVDADLAPQPDVGASVAVTAKAEDVQFTVEGTVNSAPQFVGTNLNVHLQSQNLKTLTNAAGIDSAPEYPVDLVVGIERTDKGLQIDAGKISLGDDRIEFSGSVGNKPLEKDTDVSLLMAGPNLAKTLLAFGIDADELPYAPYTLNGRVERTDDGFALHQLSIAFGSGREYEATADGVVTVEPEFLGSRLNIKARGTSLGALTDAGGIAGIARLPFAASADIERVAKGFSVKDGRADVGDDRITVDGVIGIKPLERDTDIRYSATAVDLKSTLAAFGVTVEALPAGKLTSSGSIRSRGDYFALDKVSATFADAKFDLAGRLGGLPTLTGTDLQLHASGSALSRILPAQDAFRSLDKPFSLDARMELGGDVLKIAGLRFKVDATSVTADLEAALKPKLGHGRFSITAQSPDLFRLAPDIAEVSVPETAPLELRTGGQWLGDVWTIDELFMKLGKGTLTVKGSIDRPPDFDQTDLSFNLNIASLRNFSVLAGRELPADPAQLQFRLTGTREAMTLEGFESTFGDSDIAGTFVLRDDGKKNYDATFTSRRLNLAPYLPELEDKVPPAPTGEKKIGSSPTPRSRWKSWPISRPR